MGQSPSGYICFGVPVEEEANPFFSGLDEDERIEAEEAEDVEDLPEYLLKREGVPSPWVEGEYPFAMPFFNGASSYEERRKMENDWIVEHQSEWKLVHDIYYDLKKDLEKVNLPIDIRDFSYEDIHRFVIYIPGTLQMSSGEWHSEPINPTIIEKIAGFDSDKQFADSLYYEETQAAKAFCKENGLPAFDNPCWLIGSQYG